MTTTNKLFATIFLVICICFIGCLFGCARKPVVTTVPSATSAIQETTLPHETSIPPTTTEPVETRDDFTVDLIIQLLDEVGEYLDSNTTVTLPYNKYSHIFVWRKGLAEAGIVSVTDNQIMVLDCSTADWRAELQFLLCMNLMLERYPNCYLQRVADFGYETLFFFSGYKEMGFESVSDWYWSTQAPFAENEYIVQFHYESGTISRWEMYQGTTVHIFSVSGKYSNPTEYEKYLQSKSES